MTIHIISYMLKCVNRSQKQFLWTMTYCCAYITQCILNKNINHGRSTWIYSGTQFLPSQPPPRASYANSTRTNATAATLSSFRHKLQVAAAPFRCLPFVVPSPLRVPIHSSPTRSPVRAPNKRVYALTHTHTLCTRLPFSCLLTRAIVRTLTIITLDWNWLRAPVCIQQVLRVFTCPICRTAISMSHFVLYTLPLVPRRLPNHSPAPLSAVRSCRFTVTVTKYIYRFSRTVSELFPSARDSQISILIQYLFLHIFLARSFCPSAR